MSRTLMTWKLNLESEQKNSNGYKIIKILKQNSCDLFILCKVFITYIIVTSYVSIFWASLELAKVYFPPFFLPKIEVPTTLELPWIALYICKFWNNGIYILFLTPICVWHTCSLKL